MRVARIKDGIVVNTEEATAEWLAAHDECVAAPAAGIGWSYNASTGVFTAPAVETVS